MRPSALVAVALLFVTQAFAEPSRQRELGDVDWERDFSRAQSRSLETGLPLFALFQEVAREAWKQELGALQV